MYNYVLSQMNRCTNSQLCALTTHAYIHDKPLPHA